MFRVLRSGVPRCFENLLSMYGAVVKWRNNKDLPGTVQSQDEHTSNKVPPELVSQLTKHETLDLRSLAEGNPLQIQAERHNNPLTTEKLAQGCQDAGFKQCVEIGQYSVTKSAYLAVRDWCYKFVSRIHPHSRRIHIQPKGVVGDNAIVGPIHGLLVATEYVRYGIEVKINSLAK